MSSNFITPGLLSNVFYMDKQTWHKHFLLLIMPIFHPGIQVHKTITLITGMVSALMYPNGNNGYSLNGWGLAANQISHNSNVASTAVFFLVIPSGGNNLFAFINTSIIYGN
jgi:hypothetical protein